MEEMTIEVELLDNRRYSVGATESNIKALRSFLDNPKDFLGLMGIEAAESFIQFTESKSIKFIRLVGGRTGVSHWFDEFNSHII